MSKVLTQLFQFTIKIHSKNGRSVEQLNLYIPKPNVELVRKPFAYYEADIWNDLPHDVKKHTPSIKTFKSRYITIVWSLYKPWYQMRK